MTERDEFHPATEDKVTNCPRKIAIIPTSVVLSGARSRFNGKLTEDLLKMKFSCVVWDEAHKIRRSNLREPKVWQSPEKNLLYEWALKHSRQTNTMVLATATPVQIHAVELWDLLEVLAAGNPRVLGSDKEFSPFTVKKTHEYLEEEWENTAEVLNSREAISVFLNGW